MEAPLKPWRGGGGASGGGGYKASRKSGRLENVEDTTSVFGEWANVVGGGLDRVINAIQKPGEHLVISSQVFKPCASILTSQVHLYQTPPPPQLTGYTFLYS